MANVPPPYETRWKHPVLLALCRTNLRRKGQHVAFEAWGPVIFWSNDYKLFKLKRLDIPTGELYTCSSRTARLQLYLGHCLFLSTAFLLLVLSREQGHIMPS